MTLDLGLDIHMDLPAPQAAEYATKRAEVLRKKRETVVKREERLKWEIEQVCIAPGQADISSKGQSEKLESVIKSKRHDPRWTP